MESPAAVADAVAELEAAGHRLLRGAREEPWGQTTSHLLSPEGLLIGVTYTPWMHPAASGDTPAVARHEWPPLSAARHSVLAPDPLGQAAEEKVAGQSPARPMSSQGEPDQTDAAEQGGQRAEQVERSGEVAVQAAAARGVEDTGEAHLAESDRPDPGLEWRVLEEGGRDDRDGG